MESIAERLDNNAMSFRANKKRTEYVVDSTDSSIYDFVKESVEEHDGDVMMLSTKMQGDKTYIRLLYQ